MFSKNEADETKVEFHVTEVPATLPAHSGDTLKVISKVEEAVSIYFYSRRSKV